jgi:hypothetical protein
VQVLHTSGSGGHKKRVPYTLEAFVVGLLLLANSRALHKHTAMGGPCSLEALSMLPLFHNAGIFRNVAALLVRFPLSPGPPLSTRPPCAPRGKRRTEDRSIHYAWPVPRRGDDPLPVALGQPNPSPNRA